MAHHKDRKRTPPPAIHSQWTRTQNSYLYRVTTILVIQIVLSTALYITPSMVMHFSTASPTCIDIFTKVPVNSRQNIELSGANYTRVQLTFFVVVVVVNRK